MKKIAVLGGGGTGCAIAADLTLKGFSVALYEEAAHGEHLGEVRAAGGVRLTGRGANGFARIETLTYELEEAVRGAALIFVAMIAPRQEALCAALAPLLTDGQTVCFSAGNCGSILLRRHLRGGQEIVVGEMQGNIYPCRLTEKATVTCAFPYAPKKVAAFPAMDTSELIRRMEDIYPCLPAKNIFETTFNSPNISIHLAGSLLNTCAIERNPEFRMYAQGLSPGVLTCIGQVEDEKALVMERMGYENARHLGMVTRVMDYEKHPELEDFRTVSGPDSMRHRYVSEDASTGQALLLSLARQLGIPMPCMEALETLASVINGHDYMADGRTLDALGLGGMTPEAINDYLHRGT